MAHEPRARSQAKPRSPADGVTIAPAPGARKTLMLLAAAGALAVIALLVLFAPTRSEAPAPAPREPHTAAHRDGAVAAASQRGVHPVRALAEQRAPDAAAPPGEPSRDLPVPGPSGIGLFPPPGTDPVKIGIVVPEGFELPEGYVRHYQVTDDGQELPPILMFHPDYDWVDESGAHVEVSENGVVPPELAPPGMPIEMLELPDPPSEP